MLSFEPFLFSQVHHLRVVEQGRTPLHGKGVIALQEDGDGLASGLDGDLGVHPHIFCRLVPGMPGEGTTTSSYSERSRPNSPTSDRAMIGVVFTTTNRGPSGIGQVLGEFARILPDWR